MKLAKRQATYADLVAVPERLVAEIIDGDLYASPRPAPPHAVAASVLGGDLNGAFHRPPGSGVGPGGWWILGEPELHLDRDVLVPDVAGWRRERLPVLPRHAGFTLAPDWVCEVISPSTGAIDRGRKMRIYARAGVAHLWIVDPLACTLEIYRLEGEHWVVAATYGDGGIVRLVPFEAIEIDLDRWWSTGPAQPSRTV